MSEPTEDLEDLYEEAPCGYLSLAADGQIVRMNRTLGRWLGRSPESLLGQPLHDIVGFGGRIAFETHLAPLLRLQKKVNEVALDIVTHDGTRIPVIANVAEKRDEQGTHLFTRFTFLKAEERRTYERKLQASLAQAKDAYEVEQEVGVLREQFIAVLGHDLRNPLAALQSAFRLLDKEQALSERGQTVIDASHRTVDRMSGLIEDLMDFARTRLGSGLSLDISDGSDLGPALEATVGEIQVVNTDLTIDTRIDLTQNVSCDVGRICQLCSNLLANAVTHGEDGGKIDFEAVNKDGGLVIRVSNRGSTMSDEVIQKLFEPFVREQVRPSQEGLGLGLFICSEIAKAHGGTLSVESEDSLTTFSLDIPQAGAQASSS